MRRCAWCISRSLQLHKALDKASYQQSANFSLAIQPAYDYEPEVLDAEPRAECGRLPNKKLRKDGKMPATIISLPGNAAMPIVLDNKTVRRKIWAYGKFGFLSRVFYLNVASPQESGEPQRFRVLPRVVHYHAVSDLVENVNFMHVPEERMVTVPVPVQLVGQDASLGIKRGGFVALFRRTVPVLCPGNVIPPYFEVDVSQLPFGGRVRLSELPLPPGTSLAVTKEVMVPVCRLVGRAGKD